MKKLIVTADDFGLSPAVNQAIEQAFTQGILTTTSLMAGAAYVEDAVECAERNPRLKVGLHVVVTRGRAVLPPTEIPDLVDAKGNLPVQLFQAGVRFFFLPGVREQLEQEITAQFEAFKSYGLRLDHVNAHNHMHLHPTVFALILKIGRRYGMRSVRIPYEPLFPVWRATGDNLAQRTLMTLFLGPWVALQRMRLQRAGLSSNDYIFGLFDTGHMDVERVMNLLPCLPNGVSELYFHPALAEAEGDRPLPDPRSCAMELDTLLDAGVRERLQTLQIKTVSFTDVVNV